MNPDHTGIKCPECGREVYASHAFVLDDFRIWRALICRPHGPNNRPKKLAEVGHYPAANTQVIQQTIDAEYAKTHGKIYVKCYWPAKSSADMHAVTCGCVICVGKV